VAQKEKVMDVLQYIGSIGGIAGVLAFLMFLSYRYLVNLMRDDRRFMEDRLTQLLDSYNSIVKERNQVMAKHTEVLIELITYLKLKNGGK
jgi:hypothetical protein